MGADNLYREREQLYDVTEAIAKRLKVEVGSEAEAASGHVVKGYATKAERWMKQQRLQGLLTQLEEVETRIERGRVSVVRGGRALLKKRHNLEAAGLSETQWYEAFDAARLFISADGEADKLWGNETIRLNPEAGILSLRLPTPLAHLSNTTGSVPTYVFEAPMGFSYRSDEWAGQAASGAVSYTISFDPLKNRWYLDASWGIAAVPTPSLASLKAANTLGVDLNGDHLACWVLAPDGNPLGDSIRIETGQQGSTGTRDGHLRSAITALLDLAQVHSCSSITIEDLNFADARATGRETMGRGPRGRRFRRTVSGIPTAKFRGRLTGMAANRGIYIVAVDPAYTSKWGRAWLAPLSVQSRTSTDTFTRSTQLVTGHSCAAVVIARRGKGHRARNHSTARSAGAHQRMSHGEPGVESEHNVTGIKGSTTRSTRTGQGRGHEVSKTRSREPVYLELPDAKDRSSHRSQAVLSAI
jgi:hypothetical protein